MNEININPFSKVRTEQLGHSAWRYYVQNPYRVSIGSKPIIFEASRGTGKTMFFLCNSWREKFEESENANNDFSDFLLANKHIGFYYRVDETFVISLNKKSIDDDAWASIFNCYFNVIIVKEILDFIEVLFKREVLIRNHFDDVFKTIGKIIQPDQDCIDISSLRGLIEITLTQIEVFSNNTNAARPIGLNAGSLIIKLIKTLKSSQILKNTTFHVFVDEFEVLNERQQIEINTLLKRSNSDLVIDYGVITNGIITFQTSSNQHIQPKDDFTHLCTDNSKFYESKEYEELLIKVCEKRLTETINQELLKSNRECTNILFYLQSYDRNIEHNEFAISERLTYLHQRIRHEIDRQANFNIINKEKKDEVFTALTSGSIINQRIHLALLMRRGKNAINAYTLAQKYTSNDNEYKDWFHNMEVAAVFLLCHELKVEKKYHGFSVFLKLSSGVIRSFLELVEFAFDNAINNSETPFSFSMPRSLSCSEQTKAVYYVSKMKLGEIDSYGPKGIQIKSFITALGKIFFALQTNSNSTLGEVEFNHFTTNITDLKINNQDAFNVLRHAIRYKVLEQDEPTKTKSESNMELLDFHINHIYCPAFKISHNRKRKITIGVSDLTKLLIGRGGEVEDVIIKLSKVNTTDSNSIDLFSESN